MCRKKIWLFMGPRRKIEEEEEDFFMHDSSCGDLREKCEKKTIVLVSVNVRRRQLYL